MKSRTPFLLLVFAAILAAAAGCRTPADLVPALRSSAWYEAVDTILCIADADDHGPDLGSKEWCRAVHHNLPSEWRGTEPPDVGSDAWYRLVDRTVFWLRRSTPEPDWEYLRHLAGLVLKLEVWAPEGTTPEGRWYRLSAVLQGGTAASIERPCDGEIVKHWVADLDGNRQPEIILWVRSFGTGAYGTVILHEWDGSGFRWAGDNDWHMPPDGYMGHDEVDVIGDQIVRTFPVYIKGDSNSQPTGGRMLQSYRYAGGSIQLVDSKPVP